MSFYIPNNPKEEEGKNEKAIHSHRVIVALLVGTSSQGFAEEGEICVCVSKRGGRMRLSEQCTPWETRLCWNIQGEPGEQGPLGEPGEPGEQGPSGQGCVKVYDSSDPSQYLGILLGRAGDMWIGGIEIFIPSLKKSTYIETTSGNIPRAVTYYKTPDCTGTPYVCFARHGAGGVFDVRDTVFRSFIDGVERYFKGVLPLSPGEGILSNRDSWDGHCISGSGGLYGFRGSKNLSQAIEIEIPFPFTLPVTLPLTYECQSE